jgi:hypothetical protein
MQGIFFALCAEPSSPHCPTIPSPCDRHASVGMRVGMWRLQSRTVVFVTPINIFSEPMNPATATGPTRSLGLRWLTISARLLTLKFQNSGAITRATWGFPAPSTRPWPPNSISLAQNRDGKNTYFSRQDRIKIFNWYFCVYVFFVFFLIM